MEKKEYISCCGLVCSDCDLYVLPWDDEVLEKMANFFKSRGWLEEHEGRDAIMEKKFYCKGCRSDRNDAHWSNDCHILICAVDEHGIESCADCPDFLCEKLKGHEQHGEKYAIGVERLRKMRAEREGKI